MKFTRNRCLAILFPLYGMMVCRQYLQQRLVSRAILHTSSVSANPSPEEIAANTVKVKLEVTPSVEPAERLKDAAFSLIPFIGPARTKDRLTPLLDALLTRARASEKGSDSSKLSHNYWHGQETLGADDDQKFSMDSAVVSTLSTSSVADEGLQWYEQGLLLCQSDHRLHVERTMLNIADDPDSQSNRPRIFLSFNLSPLSLFDTSKRWL